MAGKEKGKPSLTGLYRGIIIVMIPVIILVISLSFVIRYAIRTQVLDSAHASIEKQIDRLDATCYQINQSLLNLLTESGDIRTLEESEDRYERNVANMNLQREFQGLRGNFLGIFNYFYYDREDEAMIMPSPVTVDLNASVMVKARILNYLENNSYELQASNLKWKLLQAGDGTWFLVKIYHSNFSYLGCWISLDSVYWDFGVNEYSSVGQYMMIVENGKVMTGRSDYERIVGTDRLIVDPVSRFAVRDSYEAAIYEFGRGDFAFLFLTNVLEKYQNVQDFLIFLVILLVVILGAGAGMIVYIKRKLLEPVEMFISNLSLEDVESGKPPYFAELDQVAELFCSAKRQIEELKIGMYEKELDRQRVELDYLQLQIKPHFYLNCMNIIYSMAQSGHIAEIQKLSLEVSGYLRSVFREGSVPVELGEEIEHVRRYLNINAIRYEDEIEAELAVPKELAGWRIAPLLIQTLVENSVKHAMLSQRMLKVCVRVEEVSRIKERGMEERGMEERGMEERRIKERGMEERGIKERGMDGREMQGQDMQVQPPGESGAGYLYIKVEDNGPGFPREVLDTLNGGGSLTSADGHRVGLANTIRRIEYFYHGRARIAFSNRTAGGACTELWIPGEGSLQEEGDPGER